MLKDPTRDPGFEPPHCPNPACIQHSGFQGPTPYLRKGRYQRKSVPKSVQRFQCRDCRRNFSTQTFSLSYWQKKPDTIERIFLLTVGCMAARQMARALDLSVETICRHIARLARHCMLWHVQACRGLTVRGALVIDGFRSFEYSQYRPFEHQVAVEASSDFWVYHVDTELRRSGSMTRFQRRRRQKLEVENGRPARGQLGRDITELLRHCSRDLTELLVLSDEHPGYRRPIQGLGIPIEHQVTNSKLPRTTSNPLFPVNLLDLLLRHCQGNHKRETIAFSKRRQASAERAAILMIWRNFIKSRREKRPGITPAMIKGLTSRPLTVEDILNRRLFPARLELPDRWQRYYRRQIHTREIPNNREHELKYAF